MQKEKEKILIVEDNSTNIIEAEKAILGLGYKPILATNVADAIKLLKQHDFLAVLTDMQMPVKRNGGINKEAGEVVVKECLKMAVPYLVVSQGGKPGESHANEVSFLCYSDKVFSQKKSKYSFFDRLRKINSSFKSVSVWESAFELLEHCFPALPEILESRKRYRKFFGTPFNQQESLC